ncbi:hypothetical protein CONLIGDRAFT_700863, partial [Coniochaeta ligniaria NRRL 30616]
MVRSSLVCWLGVCRYALAEVLQTENFKRSDDDGLVVKCHATHRPPRKPPPGSHISHPPQTTNEEKKSQLTTSHIHRSAPPRTNLLRPLLLLLPREKPPNRRHFLVLLACLLVVFSHIILHLHQLRGLLPPRPVVEDAEHDQSKNHHRADDDGDVAGREVVLRARGAVAEGGGWVHAGSSGGGGWGVEGH